MNKMKDYIASWKSSSKPRKQRKYRSKAPLHTKLKFAHAGLSKDLRKKYGKRNIGLKKGDKVKVMRGEFKKHEGKIERIDLKTIRIFVSGVETTKKDGTKKMVALHPSNVILTEINLDDKMRQSILDRK